MRYPAAGLGATEAGTRTLLSLKVFTHLISLRAPRFISTGSNEL